MPNPGLIRYSTAFINAIALVYVLVTGNPLSDEDKAAVEGALSNGTTAALVLYNVLAMVYSKMFPSAPAA